ncbi:SDR family oxidoreductase [Flavobacterium sp. CS20]|uniref:SDR family oxidoreductase n=1 Tax=Flavobacterium sp. CS20 TaxID=2775246 RepID=UPI001B39EC19|nr:SDR family oxidoreductase [Flavobacterium sp. CS20]QTY27741.1 SDR family oxidoreductase [Flavobacterium sp. CS20]
MKGKVAFITGGSKGIGYGIAESLAQEGVHSVLTSRSQANADQVAKEISSKYNVKCLGIEADVRDYKAVKSAVDQAENDFGQIDYVIANAGLGRFGSIEELTVEQWQEVIDTNLSGVFYTIKSSVEALKKTKGYFISISSLAGENFFAGGATYNASKFGVTGFTQAVMLDLRQEGIKVTTILPGSVSTHFNGNQPDDSDAWKIQTEDLGEIVVDLFKLNPRTLPSKIEVRPTQPPKK